MATLAKAQKKICRMDVRMTEDQRAKIERAAAAKGKSITQWSLDNLLASADRDIEEESVTRLSKQAFEAFASALDAGMPKAAVELLEQKPVWE